MKLHNKLDEILDQPSKIKVLRFLFIQGDEHTGRGIAKAVSMSPSMAHRVLREMETAGIVTARKKGNAVLYGLKNGNYFVNQILSPLFKREDAIYDDVARLIKTRITKYKQEIISAAVFGSVASGQDSKKSDLDLLVVLQREADRDKAENLMDVISVDLAKKFSIALSPYIVTGNMLRKKFLKKQKIALAIVKNNRLIYGEPIERVVA